MTIRRQLISIFLRQRGINGKSSVVEGAKKVKVRDRVGRAIPVPEANAEIQANLDVCEICFSLSLSLSNIVYHLVFPFCRSWNTSNQL